MKMTILEEALQALVPERKKGEVPGAVHPDDVDEWFKGRNKAEYKRELRILLNQILQEAGELPEGKASWSKQSLTRARKEFDSVQKSWVKLLQLLRIWGFQLPEVKTNWELLVESGVTEAEPYKRFVRLKAFLYRRSSKGKKSNEAYEKSAKRVQRVRVRPSNEEEAARKRASRAKAKAQEQEREGLSVEDVVVQGCESNEEEPLGQEEQSAPASRARREGRPPLRQEERNAPSGDLFVGAAA